VKKLRQYIRRIDRLPEILTAARTFDRFLPLTLDYLDAKTLAYPLDARLPNGMRVHLVEREDIKVLWHIFVRKCYGVHGAESVILDLGANVGFFSLYAAMNAPHAKIYSAEPVPSTFQRLLNHLESNGLTDRVTAMNYAVTGTSGTRFVARENVPAGQKRLLSDGCDHASADIEVPSCTLESILERYSLDRIDMAKIDIEGSEYEVLLATPPAALRRISRLDLEVHNNITAKGYTPEVLFQHLRTGGLALTSLETDAQGFSQARFAHQP
jgi:FkbM family methyltransferase